MRNLNFSALESVQLQISKWVHYFNQGQSPTQLCKSVDRKVKYLLLSENLLLWDRSDIVKAQKRGKEFEYFGPVKSLSIS